MSEALQSEPGAPSDETAIDIATQAYSPENYSIQRDTYIYDDGSQMSNRERVMMDLARINTKTLNALRQMPQQSYSN